MYLIRQLKFQQLKNTQEIIQNMSTVKAGNMFCGKRKIPTDEASDEDHRDAEQKKKTKKKGAEHPMLRRSQQDFSQRDDLEQWQLKMPLPSAQHQVRIVL